MATIGAALTFSVEFFDSSNTAADPTAVYFWLRENIDGTELEWTYNASPVSGRDYPAGANPMVKDSAGNYHVVWAARKAERHTGFWQGTGAVVQSSQATAFVRHSDIAALEV